jgi:hypothetical protein
MTAKAAILSRPIAVSLNDKYGTCMVLVFNHYLKE